MQRWRFVNDGHGWKWQRLNGKKSRAGAAAIHKSFGAALNDALLNGFRPRSDMWTVEDTRTLATFEPGKSPKVRSK